MNRIELIASLTKGSNTVCDIGCDHAYTLIEALTKYDVKKGIAADINNGPLNSAKDNVLKNKLEDRVEFVLSDGFNNIESDFDTVVISGMGGILICDILKNGLNKIKGKKLIIEANSDQYLVRKYLTKNGFIITDEYDLVDNNKYYEVIVFEKGRHSYPGFELKYGPVLLKKKDDIYINHYKKLLAKLEEILPSIKDTIQKDEKLVLKNDYLKILNGDSKDMISIMDTDNYYREYFIDGNPRPTVIIAAGGGYKYTSPRESEPISEFFNKHNYHAVIVNYRETLESYPNPQLYLASVIRQYENDVRVTNIIGCGFSAGGHCILEVALHPKVYDARIDLLILGYPVVTTKEEYMHKGSFKNLLGNLDNKDILKRLSLEKEVKVSAPDLFLFSTFTDESVHVMNSLLLIEAYKKRGLNCEYHMFPMGGHGLSLATEKSSAGDKNKENPYVAKWTDLCLDWLKYKLNK